MVEAVTKVIIDTSDRPDMGELAFVDSQVRAMLDEARKILFEATPGSNPQDGIRKLGEKWTKLFYAGNPAFIQTMTPEAQMVWLQQHDIGTDETDPVKVVNALVALTLGRFINASTRYAEGEITDDQLQFWIETAVEDCQTLLRGLENQAD